VLCSSIYPKVNNGFLMGFDKDMKDQTTASAVARQTKSTVRLALAASTSGVGGIN